jgi:hypothetical protein
MARPRHPDKEIEEFAEAMGCDISIPTDMHGANYVVITISAADANSQYGQPHQTHSFTPSRYDGVSPNAPISLSVNGMDQYSFTVEVGGAIVQNPHYQDVIYEAGCDDALIALIDGKMLIDFDRSAASYNNAVASAVAALEGIGATIVNVSPITD